MSGRPLVLLYDLDAGATATPVEERLAACRRYAADRDWLTVGTWIDGDPLPTDPHPELDQALALVRRLRDRRDRDRTVLVLAHSHHHLGRDPEWVAARIAAAGAGLEVVHDHGRLTGPVRNAPVPPEAVRRDGRAREREPAGPESAP